MAASTDHALPVWSRSAESVLEDLAVDPTRGLGEQEVLQRRGVFGSNQLVARRQRSAIAIAIDQFKSIVIVLLVVAGTLAVVFSDFAEAAAIFAVLLINGAIGFVTEWRATRSMEALRRFAQVTCVLRREGRVRQAAAEELVPGDIVLLDAGDLVPADLRVVEAAKLNADESTLTGESMPVHKHTDPLPEHTVMLDRRNMVYKGTAISRGSGIGVVIGTGMQTEFGKIFKQIGEAKSQRTPLEKRLDRLGARLASAALVICVFIAIGGILAGRGMLLSIEVAIALAVAAIPEGLPIVATIALARGMWRMARRGALITRLSAVETLGATSVILTDKTGTLTENRMTVTRVLLPDKDIALDEAVSEETAALLQGLFATAALCNNATLQRPDNGQTTGVGDPTELALLEAASQFGIWRADLLEEAPEEYEDAFDEERKRMATVHRRNDRRLVAVKGAPEVIMSHCGSVHTCRGIAPLDVAALHSWHRRVDSICARGLRTIALADKLVDAYDEDLYDNLVLHGVVGLEDPAREGIHDAISLCRDAGIGVVMVTGDHAETARNIAREIGVVDAGSEERKFLGGEKVDRMFEESRNEDLLAVRVYSRVTPEQKLRLIGFYQQAGQVVAMTGDGVNDAPALKKADIGIAMGQRGTAVAREASAMVLQDDDLDTIVAAIDLGRAIFDNIRKFVLYLLSCNISEVLVVSLATIAGAPLPLLPLQILFLNLVTDVFPALALGVGPTRESLMKEAPRPATERILMRVHWIEIGLYGLVMALAVLAAMAIAVYHLEFDREKALTVSFCTLALTQLWHVFNMRGNLKQIIRNEITQNVWIWLALALCVVLVLAAVYIPVLSKVMMLSSPGTAGWLVIFVGSIVPLLVAPIVRRVAGALQ